jgi:ribosomal protein RSM22 (predicted rRNA methylase)
MQRPAFIRHTKHSGVGHEDVGYSYVVVRRGKRPVYSANQAVLGRVGAIGHDANKAQMEKEQKKVIRELEVHVEGEEMESAVMTLAGSSAEESRSKTETITPESEGDDLSEALRLESYAWPRLIFPPLKRSGHIILDVCAPSGTYHQSFIPFTRCIYSLILPLPFIL